MDKKETGRVGEDLATAFLAKLGYKVLARNFQTRLGELDIIAQDGKELVIVEVKSRRTSYFGYPEEFVNPSKLAKIRRASLEFLSKKPFEDWRIDVISVITEPRITIKHFKNITG